MLRAAGVDVAAGRAAVAAGVVVVVAADVDAAGVVAVVVVAVVVVDNVGGCLAVETNTRMTAWEVTTRTNRSVCTLERQMKLSLWECQKKLD
jgi:hypothetical protein